MKKLNFKKMILWGLVLLVSNSQAGFTDFAQNLWQRACALSAGQKFAVTALAIAGYFCWKNGVKKAADELVECTNPDKIAQIKEQFQDCELRCWELQTNRYLVLSIQEIYGNNWGHLDYVVFDEAGAYKYYKKIDDIYYSQINKVRSNLSTNQKIRCISIAYTSPDGESKKLTVEYNRDLQVFKAA